MKLLIRCILNPQKLDKLIELRPLHRQYIESVKDQIDYAGILRSSNGSYSEIIYIYNSEQILDAESFIKGEPYNELFQDIIYGSFETKISLGELL